MSEVALCLILSPFLIWAVYKQEKKRKIVPYKDITGKVYYIEFEEY